MEIKPATPPEGANPGSEASVITPPSTSTPSVVPEGKVIIGTKEFAQLSRDAARGRSAQRRIDLGVIKPTTPDTGSPDANQAIQDANERAAIAEQAALQAQVRSGVRDLLEKDEFKTLPKSTKELILKNPAILSSANNLDEALLDIEDFVRDSVLSMEKPAAAAAPSAQPAGHDTPPVVGGGGPAAAGADQLEDLSKLTGSARSTAAIRNALKLKKG